MSTTGPGRQRAEWRRRREERLVNGAWWRGYGAGKRFREDVDDDADARPGKGDLDAWLDGRRQ